MKRPGRVRRAAWKLERQDRLVHPKACQRNWHRALSLARAETLPQLWFVRHKRGAPAVQQPVLVARVQGREVRILLAAVAAAARIGAPWQRPISKILLHFNSGKSEGSAHVRHQNNDAVQLPSRSTLRHGSAPHVSSFWHDTDVRAQNIICIDMLYTRLQIDSSHLLVCQRLGLRCVHRLHCLATARIAPRQPQPAAQPPAQPPVATSRHLPPPPPADTMPECFRQSLQHESVLSRSVRPQSLQDAECFKTDLHIRATSQTIRAHSQSLLKRGASRSFHHFRLCHVARLEQARHTLLCKLVQPNCRRAEGAEKFFIALASATGHELQELCPGFNLGTEHKRSGIFAPRPLPLRYTTPAGTSAPPGRTCAAWCRYSKAGQ